MSFLLIVAIVAAYAILSSAWKFYRNYQDAIRSGLPVILCPVNNQSILYIIAQVPLRPILARFLPEPLFDRVRLSIFGWEFLDKGAIHERVGPAFILVTAGVNELWCADPHMAQSILSRRKDFVQLPIGSKILRFLGENILTSDGDDWSRQRRLIAPSLNERISEIVWDESTTQTERMIDYLLDQPDSDSRHASNLLRTIAINVLAQVGYGEPRPFEPLTLPRDAHARMTYVEGISLCTELLVVAALVPGALLRLPFMPSQIRTLGAALGALPELTADMLHHERKRIASGAEASGAKSIASDADGERKVAHNTFMSQLVRLSDQGKAGNGAFGPSQFLREDEIAGNLFVFTAAGYDTTANTMTYAVGLMAAYPQWQAWLQDELDRVLGSKAVGESRILPYTTYFPKLKRCLAVMMETLRLYPALIHISRSISHDQAIGKEGENYIIPGPCTVYINNAGLHHAREDWGNDAGDFRPSRWLTLNSDGTEAELITPARGTFLPWSGGPRVCPGQKMAQVEFVTVMSTLLARLRVEPMPTPGRSVEERREDLLKLMENSQPRLTLQMNRPEQFALRWIPR